MSDKLETTINQLRRNNSQLEKDIQEKSNKKYSQGSPTKATHLKNNVELKKIFGLRLQRWFSS